MSKQFLPLYISAKIIKIDRDFPKLWSQMYCHLFLWFTVYFDCTKTSESAVNVRCRQAIDLPTATYPLSESIPHDVITSAQLSSLQLEGILYAVS